MSNSDLMVLQLYNKGYRIIKGEFINPKGKKLKLMYSKDGYLKTGGYLLENKLKCTSVRIHKLVAYQKYGDKIFKENIEIRHKDNNKLNNLEDNILIGTHSENMMDFPKEKRIAIARKNKEILRRFDDNTVKNIRNDRNCGFTYKMLCEKYNTSKSTLSFLFNKAMY